MSEGKQAFLTTLLNGTYVFQPMSERGILGKGQFPLAGSLTPVDVTAVVPFMLLCA